MPRPFLGLSGDHFDPMNDVNKPDLKEIPGVFKWDEYYGGDLNDWRWLGRPVGPAQQELGDLDTLDLLSGVDWQWQTADGFAADCTRDGGVFTADVKRTPADVIPRTLWFGVQLAAQSPPKALAPGDEYTIVFDACGEDGWSCAGQRFERVPRMIAMRGIAARQERLPVSVLADRAWRTYRISLVASGDAQMPITFGVSEQIGRTSLRNIRLYKGGAERWRREFEKGMVLLNMARTPWMVNVGTGYRRLKGTQCPEINTGEAVNGTVTVPAQDALFLTRGQ